MASTKKPAAKKAVVAKKPAAKKAAVTKKLAAKKAVARKASAGRVLSLMPWPPREQTDNETSENKPSSKKDS